MKNSKKLEDSSRMNSFQIKKSVSSYTQSSSSMVLFLAVLVASFCLDSNMMVMGFVHPRIAKNGFQKSAAAAVEDVQKEEVVENEEVVQKSRIQRIMEKTPLEGQ